MQLKNFYTIFEKIINCDHVNGIMLGSTGESYLHPNIDMIFDYVEEKQKKVPIVPISLTTNGSLMHRIPKIDTLIISFNGLDKQSYEQTTGLNFENTLKNIRSNYLNFQKNVKNSADNPPAILFWRYKIQNISSRTLWPAGLEFDFL